jgi:hypothetical protein
VKHIARNFTYGCDITLITISIAIGRPIDLYQPVTTKLKERRILRHSIFASNIQYNNASIAVVLQNNHFSAVLPISDIVRLPKLTYNYNQYIHVLNEFYTQHNLFSMIMHVGDTAPVNVFFNYEPKV